MISASIAAPSANADDSDMGCEHIRWGFLGKDVRTICDGPLRPDGSWERGRLISTPAHILPAKTTCSGTYSVTCTFYEKRYVDRVEIEKVFYTVTDDSIPAGEPGWLASGISIGNA
jgi:hypothetical protein